MFQSRERFSNGTISIAVDTKSGSILELTNESNGDNLVKNHRHSFSDTFELHTTDGKKLTVPKAEAIYKNKALTAEIVRLDDGLQVNYSRLSDGTNTYDIALTYKFRLFNNYINWEITFENHSDETIKLCKFPYICGVWLGDSYADDTLVYPFNAGIKLPNPTECISMPRNQIGWRWQDYKYIYNLDGMGLWPDKHGVYALTSKYSGPLSMAYCDLFDKDSGLYVGSHSNGEGIVSIFAEAMGNVSAGINLAVANEIFIANNESFTYKDAVTALHGGDWHEGAEIYKASKTKCSFASTTPDWFLNNPGLFAHYDFKYQNGGVVHKFCDIPSLADQAKSVGLKHLLFAGWHFEGFDYGFPNYEIDPDLGTLDELKEGIEYAHSLGVMVSFYINSRLLNTKYTELNSLIEDGAIIKHNQSGTDELFIERYGNLDLQFAVMCSNSESWQKRMCEAFDYVKAAGADGIYFDQIAMAPPCMCFNEMHGHKADDWNKGCVELLKLANERGLTLIIEGCSDIYGDYAAGQLVSTFSYIALAFPEMYRYTFPKHILVDMVYPRRKMAMRPTFIGDKWKLLIDINFICGNYFWAYDLEYDNSFTNDETAYTYLKEAVAVRKQWLSAYGHGTFLDDKNLFITGDIKAKFYKDPYLIAFSCENSGSIELPNNLNIENIILSKDNDAVSVKINGSIIVIEGSTLGVIKLL